LILNENPHFAKGPYNRNKPMLDLKIDPRMVLSQASQPDANRKDRDLAELKRSSQEFEALLVMEMLKAMRKAIPEGGLFEKGMAEETFQEMLDMETARATTRAKSLGIADAIYRQMAGLIENRRE
jgi:flagellar protein FlgJ